jgi:hypothetical protein
MLDLVNVALRTLMCLAFLIWVVRPMLFALSRREPNQVEIEEIVDSAVHSAFKSLGVKNPPPRLPSIAVAPHTETEVPTEPPEPATVLEQPLATDGDVQPASSEVVATEEAPVNAEGLDSAMEGSEPEPDPDEALRQMRERIKQEQKKSAKPSIPAELLQDASSYEDKLMVVRMMVDQEHARVASVLKRMIKIE